MVATGDAPPRDQRDLMERPFFSLAKAKRVTPILYESGGVRVEVFGVMDAGIATIWDADILICRLAARRSREQRPAHLALLPLHALSASHGHWPGHRRARIPAAEERADPPPVHFHPHHDPSGRALAAASVLRINEWEELTTRDGRIEGMEFVLPDWFYRGVIDRSLVLAIDPAYFRLTGGIERWLYRVARKHAGHQPHGWLFEVTHLHQKSGSMARISDFALDLRRIAAKQSLLGYRLDIFREGRREYLQIRPENLSTVPVDNPVERLVTSGAKGIGTSGAALSGFRAHGPQLSLWPEKQNPTANLESNKDLTLLL